MSEQDIDFFFGSPVSMAERRRRAALHDGLAHGSHITPRDPTPGEPVALTFQSNASLPIDQVAVYYTTDGTEPAGVRGSSETSDVVLAQPGELTTDPATGERARIWQATIPGQPDGTLVRYRADGWSYEDTAGHWYADNVDPVGRPPDHGQLFAYSVDRFRPPAWFDDAVIYQIFVDRFATGAGEHPLSDPGTISGIFGGTLRGVLEKLDYIQSLGITCIWLTPVFESPSAHGYDPADYYH
ncbi:MAG TPA: alpha-amylase family glycosyl hydrolase, partial [Ktedonobacterales bacterium]|nr:alpha-amylase family glycosyl hydrolase [Ktedonobacterales bacterium]